MTPAQFASLTRRYTNTNSTTYQDADLLVDANNVKNEIASLITKYNDNYFIIPTLDNLVANQREYALADDLLNHLIRMELAFTSDLAYLQAEYFDPRRFGDGLTETKIASYFSNSAPKYFIQRRALYILSGTIISVTDGIRYWRRKFPADLTDLSLGTDMALDPSTTTFGMPKQFHELWARKTSIVWKSTRPKPIPLNPLELNYEKDLLTALEQISNDDKSESQIASLPYNDGSQF